MKKTIFTLILSLVIYISAIGQSKNFIDQPYIEVGGYSDTLVTPNLIYIKILIAEKDSRDKIPLEEQENKMITAFKSLDINTETDLTTSDMLSNYKFYLLRQKDVLKSKEYILKVTTAETASKVFILLEDLGISNTSIQNVDHTDIEKIQSICKIKAIENSKKNAIALTKPISQTIGNAIHIVDNESNFDYHNNKGQEVRIREMSSLNKAKFEAPKIEFEKIKVSASVKVKYILK